MIDVGSVLGGRYRLNARVGIGGMAVVYDSEDLFLERRVAVKVPLPALAADPAFLARFANEARAAAALSHPNIVAVYDVGEDANTPYLVLEFVAGETLRERLAREGPLPPAEVARIGAQIADALGAAHARGLIHRDVKPGNILLTADGRARLTDFGIALALGAQSHTRAGTLLGSIHYLAPEQVRGEGATPASDIYALGVVLYEMATGAVPYGGDNPLAIAAQHAGSEPPRPSAVVPGLPPALEQTILRALRKTPAERHASASALAAALRGERQAAAAGGLAPTEQLSAAEVRGASASAPPPPAAEPATTQAWSWGAQGPSPWAQAAEPPPSAPTAPERTQSFPVRPLPATQAPAWTPAVPAAVYPSARWPIVLLGIISLLCVLGLVPMGMLAYRQLRLPNGPPRAVPGLSQTLPPLAQTAAAGGAMSLLPLRDTRPQLAPDAYVAPGAWLIGAVTLGPGASVWFNAVLRADDEPIIVGARSNLQDAAIVHVDRGSPTRIGDEVTVGHAAIVHGATVESRVLVGMRAVILSGAVIGEGSIIGAAALVPEGRVIPPRSLVLGVPGRVVREVTDEEYAGILRSAEGYAQRAILYRGQA